MRYKWIKKRYVWFPHLFNLEDLRIEKEDLDWFIERIKYVIKDHKVRLGLCQISHLFSDEQSNNSIWNKRGDIHNKMRILCNCSEGGYWWERDRSSKIEAWYKPRLEFLHELKELFGYK
jgi:hypothetical protein